MKSKEDGPLKQLTGKVRQFHQHVDAPIRQKPTLLPSDGDEAAENGNGFAEREDSRSTSPASKNVTSVSDYTGARSGTHRGGQT